MVKKAKDKSNTTIVLLNDTKIKNNNEIELGKEIPSSVISVRREQILNIDIIDPKTLDIYYATVPEVTRAIDLRGAAIIYRGYEITARDDSEDAKKFADICSYVLNYSGGVNFVEQWQKNADLYGNGYVELVDDNGKIVELCHVHPYNFGYELETFYDPVTYSKQSKIKLDNDTQKPVGYASYKYNDLDGIYENDKTYDKERVAHLKYKMIGDSLYGISLIQPMGSSIISKLKMENNIDAAGRLVAAPKIVMSGNFPTEEEARMEAKEAASLDTKDVVILSNGESFQIINPGDIKLPQLREIFVINITTASGIPRPVLTSESAEINKATMQELMKQLRENMRSNMNKLKHVMEHEIFERIGKSYGISNYQNLIPIFDFPEDVDTEQEIIIREEKKAATLTSLSNSMMILNNILMSSGSNLELSKNITNALSKTTEIYVKTVDTFMVNNDQNLGQIEESVIVEDNIIKLDDSIMGNNVEQTTLGSPDSVDVESSFTPITLIDDIRDIKQPQLLLQRHNLMHKLYEAILKGAEIFDIETGSRITLAAVVKKHMHYIGLMETIGMIHEHYEVASELDGII